MQAGFQSSCRLFKCKWQRNGKLRLFCKPLQGKCNVKGKKSSGFVLSSQSSSCHFYCFPVKVPRVCICCQQQFWDVGVWVPASRYSWHPDRNNFNNLCRSWWQRTSQCSPAHRASAFHEKIQSFTSLSVIPGFNSVPARIKHPLCHFYLPIPQVFRTCFGPWLK